MLRAVICLATRCLVLCALVAVAGCETTLPRFARPPGARIDAGADAGSVPRDEDAGSATRLD